MFVFPECYFDLQGVDKGFFDSVPELVWIATVFNLPVYLFENGISRARFDQPSYLKLDLTGNMDYFKRTF